MVDSAIIKSPTSKVVDQKPPPSPGTVTAYVHPFIAELLGPAVLASYPPWKTKAPTTTESTYPLDAASAASTGVTGITGNAVNVAIPVKVEVVLAVKTPPEVRVPVVDRVPGAIMVLERLAVMVSPADSVRVT